MLNPKEQALYDKYSKKDLAKRATHFERRWLSSLKTMADLEGVLRRLRQYAIEQIGIEHVPVEFGGELE